MGDTVLFFSNKIFIQQYSKANPDLFLSENPPYKMRMKL